MTTMVRWLEVQGYRLCWRGDWITRLWAPIWFRFYCPYPIIEDVSARACIKAGHCGCNNGADTKADHE
jgi:hypothetical protein